MNEPLYTAGDTLSVNRSPVSGVAPIRLIFSGDGAATRYTGQPTAPIQGARLMNEKPGLGNDYRRALTRFIPVMLVGAGIWLLVLVVLWKLLT